MTIYLNRHAKAGVRDAWVEDDRLRPLSVRGHTQARELVDQLADATFERILSSPFVRCMETVVPIAGARGRSIEPVDVLAEESRLEDVLPLVRKHAISGALICTHGDVMAMLLDFYASSGVEFKNELEWPKGCTWVLDTDNTGEVVRARYLPPPPA